jgi:hypothetical protein
MLRRGASDVAPSGTCHPFYDFTDGQDIGDITNSADMIAELEQDPELRDGEAVAAVLVAVGRSARLSSVW